MDVCVCVHETYKLLEKQSLLFTSVFFCRGFICSREFVKFFHSRSVLAFSVMPGCLVGITASFHSMFNLPRRLHARITYSYENKATLYSSLSRRTQPTKQSTSELTNVALLLYPQIEYIFFARDRL